MFWNRSLSPPSRQPSPSATPKGGDYRDAINTAISFLSTYGRGGFDIEETTANDLERECGRWCDSLSTSASQRPILQGSQAPSRRANWSGLLSFIEQHRSAERQSVVQGREELGLIIRSFARVFQQMLSEDRAGDVGVERELKRLDSGLEYGDPAQVRDAAEQLTHFIVGTTKARQEAAQRRLNVLQKHAEDLTRRLARNRRANALDAETQLYSKTTFEEHLRFLAAVGGLLPVPPQMLLCQTDLARVNQSGADPSALANMWADELVRSYYARDQYVARVGTWCFAVLTAGLAHSEAQRLATELHRNLTRHPIVSRCAASVVLCSSVAGEDPVQWRQRAFDALERTQPGRLELMAIPAQFE